MPAMALSRIAASRTVRQIGPEVSWLWEIGTMPARLSRPTVGLRPTSDETEDGETIEPSVSVPTDTAQKFDAVATPDPELEPDGLRSSAYGLRVWPPRPLHPLQEWVER